MKIFILLPMFILVTNCGKDDRPQADNYSSTTKEIEKVTEAPPVVSIPTPTPVSCVEITKCERPCKKFTPEGVCKKYYHKIVCKKLCKGEQK